MNQHGSHPNETSQAPAPGPHVCRVCSRPFLVPMSIVNLVSQHGYVVELRCSNCEDASVALLDDDQMERLDRELDRQAGDIRHAIAEMKLADELERVDRFATALHAGHILPEDF